MNGMKGMNVLELCYSITNVIHINTTELQKNHISYVAI